MKKRAFPTLIALMLILGLLGLSAATAGAESPETGYMDVSDQVLHLGGWLPDAPAQALRPRGDDNAAVKKAIYDALCARLSQINISSYRITKNDIGTVYRDVLNEHPELFYVDGGFSYYSSGSYVTILEPDYDSSYTEADVAAYRSTLQGIIGMVDQGWSDVEKALFLHDYLVTHCEYDLTYSRYSAYDALVVGSSVCQGYALAYGDLCRKSGVSAAYVSSQAINHAWNLVTVGGEKFFVDCTWDDPSNNWYEGNCLHENFLLSKSALAQNHDGDDWVSSAENVYANDSTSSRYDGAWWKNVRTAVPLIGHIGAYALENDSSHIFLRDMSGGSVTALSLTGSTTWPVWGSNGSYWSDNYSSVAELNGVFYFTRATEVWSLSPAGQMGCVYTLTPEEAKLGYIYGIVNDGGTLYYNIGQRPWSTSFTRCALEAGPVTGECDGFTYAVLDDGTASVVDCALTGAVAIPDTLDGYTVTNLAARLFFGADDVTAVTIPATVTSFGEDPTDNDGDCVFAYCAGLTRIDVDPDNPSFCSEDGVLYSKDRSTLIAYPCSRAGDVYHTEADCLCGTSFASCDALKFVFIDNPDCWWYTDTFYDDPGLTAFYLTGGEAEQKAAQDQAAGHVQDGTDGNPWCRLVSAENIRRLPEELVEIEEEAFRGTDVLYLIAPDSCERIGQNAFADSSLLYLRVGENTEIEEGALPAGAVTERR